MITQPDLTDINGYSLFEPVTLRFSDQDSLGHINNVAYAALFESGRLGFFDAAFGDGRNQDQNFVLAHLKIDYLKEMHFPGTVQVGGRLLKIGRSSMTSGYAAFLNGVCYATSVSVNVHINRETRRAAPFSDAMRVGLEAML